MTESGNRYTVPFAFDDYYGVGGTGHQVFPLQGPYQGQGVMTEDGPAEWGHPPQPPLPFIEKINLNLHPLTSFAYIGHEHEMRLACQARVNGDCSVVTQPALNLSGETFWQKPYPNK